MGPLVLGVLATGKARRLTHAEVEALRNTAFADSEQTES